MISQKMQSLVQNSSVIRAMFEEGNRLAKIYGPENVFDFSIGNPSVAPPEQIRKAIIDIAQEENPLQLHGYMNNSGYEEVRQAIAEHLNAQHGCALSCRDIVMTCGAAGGLNVILKTLLNPGDEVIVLAPFFSEYANYIANYDGRMVVVNTDPDTFQPDLNRLEAAITARTKAVILNTPNNPTGVIYSAETLSEMAALVNMSEPSFSRFIKRRTGYNFIDCLNNIRISAASRRLIDEPANTIAEIAFKCGFNNLSNFNRIFKKYKGYTPHDFREYYDKKKIII